MRILHVHDRAGFQGGVEQILFDTAQGLTAQGWSQGLLTDQSDVDARFAGAFESVSTRLQEAVQFQPDAVLLHKVSDSRRVSAVAKLFPTAHMVHDHDLVCPRRHKYFPTGDTPCNQPAGWSCFAHLCFVQRTTGKGAIPIRFSGTGEVRRQLNAANSVRRHLVGSQYMKRELEMNGIPSSHIAIVHPVPAALREPRMQAPAKEPELLFVGQVIRGKGVDLMLRALAANDTWTATIVGDGNHLDACRALADKLGISGRVTFAGWVPHEQLEAYYARARAVIVPSRWPEPFGMVGIEAMARGRAVIAFDNGGISDWLEDESTGILVPSADVPAMAAAIGRLLADPDLANRMGQAGADRVARDFSHQAYLAGIRTQLESIQ